MTVPVELRGAWRRRELALEGGAPFEYQDAWWIQAAHAFVDVRAEPDGHGGTAFCGVTDVAGDVISWRHDLDVGPTTGSEDRATWSLDGRVLTEQGTVDLGEGPVTYTEWWECVAPTTTTSVGRPSSGRGLIVVCGDHLGVVADGDTPGGWILDLRDGSTLVATRSDGDVRTTSPPVQVDGPSGRRWSIHEESP